MKVINICSRDFVNRFVQWLIAPLGLKAVSSDHKVIPASWDYEWLKKAGEISEEAGRWESKNDYKAAQLCMKKEAVYREISHQVWVYNELFRAKIGEKIKDNTKVSDRVSDSDD